jgi:hypothetical protein
MTESPSAPRPDRPVEPARSWRWAARGVVVLPIVVAVLRALAEGWFPVGDTALLAVRAGDVLTRDHPWLGSWTSASLAVGIDVNNPGPLYYDLAAPVMWTVGRAFGTGPATAIAVGSINIAAAVGIVAVGRHMGGWRVERWMLLLVAALAWSMGSELLFDIWQPHALLMPFLLLCVLTVAVADGRLRLLPWWIGVASLVVQTHVAYVFVTVALALLVSASIVHRYRTDRPEIGRTWATTAIVVGLCWIQPIIEQLFGRGQGNLQRLITHAGGGDLTVGSRTAVKIVAAIVGLPPFWTRFGYEDSVRSTPLTDTAGGPRLFVEGLPNGAVAALTLLAVIALLATLVAVLKAPSQQAARWAAIVAGTGVVVAVGGVSIQAVTLTGLGSHQIRWLFALSLFVHLTIVWGAVEWWRGSRSERPRERALDVVLAIAVVTLTLANLPVHAHDLGPVADRAAASTLARTFDDLSAFEPQGPVVYDVDNLRVFEPYSSAVLMRLDELGVEFRFTDDVLIRQFGEHRRAGGDELLHLRQYERADALLLEGEACVLSLRSGVDPSVEDEADALIAGAAADLAAGAVAVDVDGLPSDIRSIVQASVEGNTDAAFRVVADDLLAVLVSESRLEPTPAIAAAVERRDLIVARVNSTLMVSATPRQACEAAPTA